MADDVKTLVLFALEREVAPFRPLIRGRTDLRVEVTGVGSAAVERVLPSLVTASRLDHVIMAGFCGALCDRLRVGDVIVPDTVVDEHGGRWTCTGIEPRPQGSDGRRLSLPKPIQLLTTNRMIGDPEAKRHLGERYHAAIVDMESAAAARVCANRGIPFAAIRAVSDSEGTRLSPELLSLLVGGHVSLVRVTGALLRRPKMLWELLRLGRDTKLAADRLANELCDRLVIDSSLSKLTPPPHSPASLAPRSPS